MLVRFASVRLVPVVIAGLLFVLACLQSHADASQRNSGAVKAPTFDDLYARGQELNRNIKTLTAHFVETTTNSLLRDDRPIIARGTLYVERPARVALQYSDPADQRIVIDGKWMTTIARGVRQKMDIGAAQNRVQKYFVQGDAGELRRVFEIDLRERSSRAGTREVVMLPKRKQIQEALAKLELWVAEDSSLLKAMRMTFANGDTKLMEFENVVPNAPVNPAVFVVTP